MTAFCKCTNGHTFTCRVVADEPNVNALIVEADACPECGAEFEVVETEYDEPREGDVL